jgi:hypothetical protein
MGAKFAAIATMVVIGLMLADALTHPAGTSALGQSASSLLSIGGNQLIGVQATQVKPPGYAA